MSKIWSEERTGREEYYDIFITRNAVTEMQTGFSRRCTVISVTEVKRGTEVKRCKS